MRSNGTSAAQTSSAVVTRLDSGQTPDLWASICIVFKSRNLGNMFCALEGKCRKSPCLSGHLIEGYVNAPKLKGATHKNVRVFVL